MPVKRALRQTDARRYLGDGSVREILLAEDVERFLLSPPHLIFPPFSPDMIKNRDKLYIHTRQYVNKSAALSGDNSTFISYRANVAEACGIYGDFVRARLPARRAAPRLSFARAPSRAGAFIALGKRRRFAEASANSRTRRKQRESPAPRRGAAEYTPPPCVYGKARNAPNAQKSGTPARPACVDTLSAVSLYAPAEVTNILGSHVERPGNMMTSTSTMNMEVRKYGM